MLIGKIAIVFISIFILQSMQGVVFARVLFVDENTDFSAHWLDPQLGSEESFKKILRIIKRSGVGRELLQKANRKAYQQGETLLDIIKVGELSVSDTTLLRKFYPQNPEQIIYETKSKIFLNKELNLMDGVLDLAHELTHYTHRSAFNPYLSNFNLIDFIKSTIEGTGGEVDAFLMECRILKELFGTTNKYNGNCKKLLDPITGDFLREKGIELFYQVGEYYKATVKTINLYGENVDLLGNLNSHDAIYISSAYGLPYPLAAVKEFVSIMDRVCVNDHKRLSLLKKKSARMPASVDREYHIQRIDKEYLSFKQRCQKHI